MNLEDAELVFDGPRRPSFQKQVTIRLDADVLDGLRATGAGRQTRVNEALREWRA